MRRLLGFLFLVSLNMASGFAFAVPKILVEDNNGFETHYVDVGTGNSIGIAFQVPYGTLHDFGRFMGRAHLLEHLMHVGTLEYPGYHAFDELLEPAGIESNAYTSPERTMYFASANESQAKLMIQVFLSMLRGLELEPGTVDNEKAVVINEVVEEGVVTQMRAFSQMPFTQLLNSNHPWSVSMLGNRESLTDLSIRDIRDLYEQLYRAGIVKIWITGNFSKPGSLEEVRGWMKEFVRPSPLQNGKPIKLTKKEKRLPEKNLATRAIPSMFSEPTMAPESEKRLHIHSEDFHIGQITLEADSSDFPANPHAMKFLCSYLGSELPGSFLHKLKYELGWITEGSVYPMNIRGRQLLYFSYTMSESGRAHGREINEYFFRGLKDTQQTLVSEDFMGRTKRILLRKIEKASRSVSDFMLFYSEPLLRDMPLEQNIEALKNLTASDLRNVAVHFRPDQALYSFAGPELPEMDYDPIYKRKFKLEDNRPDLERYVEIMRSPRTEHFRPTIRTVDLGQADPKVVSLFTQTKPGVETGERFALDLRPSLPDTALSLDLKLNFQSPTDAVVVDLILEAFGERYAPEMTYILSEYLVALGGSRTPLGLALSASGENSYAARAIAWRLERLADFVPTEGELRRASERYYEDQLGEYVQAFSAQVAVPATKKLIDPMSVSGLEAAKIAKSISLDDVKTVWQRLMARADRNLSAAGAMNGNDIARVHRAGKKLVGAQLDSGDKANMRNRLDWRPEGRIETGRFQRSKGDDAYAIVRYYKGPQVSDLKEAMAFRALGSLLGQRVYIYNRGEQKLGYIHNAAARVIGTENLYFVMYGGTNGADNAGKTTAGWTLVLERLKNGETTDQEIANAISSEANGLARKKTTASALIAQYMDGLSTHGDPRISRKELEIVNSLTPADVRAVAQKYLLGDGTPYTQLTLNGCEADLR